MTNQWLQSCQITPPWQGCGYLSIPWKRTQILNSYEANCCRSIPGRLKPPRFSARDLEIELLLLEFARPAVQDANTKPGLNAPSKTAIVTLRDDIISIVSIWCLLEIFHSDLWFRSPESTLRNYQQDLRHMREGFYHKLCPPTSPGDLRLGIKHIHYYCVPKLKLNGLSKWLFVLLWSYIFLFSSHLLCRAYLYLAS